MNRSMKETQIKHNNFASHQWLQHAVRKEYISMCVCGCGYVLAGNPFNSFIDIAFLIDYFFLLSLLTVVAVLIK